MNDKEKKTILIVDDQPSSVHTLETLEDEYEVLVATDGKTALELAERMPDLILLDLNMSEEMNGFDLCKQLKKNRQTADIPIVFITILDNPVFIRRFYMSGGVDYIIKPLDVNVVKAIIKTHIYYYKSLFGIYQRTKKLNLDNQRILKQQIISEFEEVLQIH
ncbi:MAG: response regulator [Candidatus Omnitrophota bacterium]